MMLIIDRFEGDYAIIELEDHSTEQMPLTLIPTGAKEGDCLSICIDQEQTSKRKKTINKLIDDIFE